MPVFVTGATGFIVSLVVRDLLNAGHQVLGLTRSDAGAKLLTAAGVQVHRGSLEDPASLSDGAANSGGAIHCAFDHDFANFIANCEKDRRAIKAIGEALVGSDRPLVMTSGTGMENAEPGKPATENVFNLEHPNPRTSLYCTCSPCKSAKPARGITRSPKKVCRSERSPKSSAEA